MPKDIYDIMLNPARMRIIQAFDSYNSTTANEICEIISDIPRTTLYRHINILIEADVITVTDERKVRGSVERTLSLNIDELSKQSAMDNIPQQAFRFFMVTYAKFKNYFSMDNSVPGTNTIFFNSTVMMMDDLEFDQFLSELQALFVKYRFDARDGRVPRDISIISSPPTLTEREED